MNEGLTPKDSVNKMVKRMIVQGFGLYGNPGKEGEPFRCMTGNVPANTQPDSYGYWDVVTAIELGYVERILPAEYITEEEQDESLPALYHFFPTKLAQTKFAEFVSN